MAPIRPSKELLLLGSLKNMAINNVKLKTVLSQMRPNADFDFGGNNKKQIFQW